MAASLRDDDVGDLLPEVGDEVAGPPGLLQAIPAAGANDAPLDILASPLAPLGRIWLPSPTGALAVDVLVLRAPPGSPYHYLNNLKFILTDAFVRLFTEALTPILGIGALKNCRRAITTFASGTSPFGPDSISAVAALAYVHKEIMHRNIDTTGQADAPSVKALLALTGFLGTLVSSGGHGAQLDDLLPFWSEKGIGLVHAAFLLAMTYGMVPPAYPNDKSMTPIDFLRAFNPIGLETVLVASGFDSWKSTVTHGFPIHRNERKRIHDMISGAVTRPKMIAPGSTKDWSKEDFTALLRGLGTAPGSFTTLHIVLLPGPEATPDDRALLEDMLFTATRSIAAYAGASKSMPCIHSIDHLGQKVSTRLKICPLVANYEDSGLWQYCLDVVRHEIVDSVPCSLMDRFAGLSSEYR